MKSRLTFLSGLLLSILLVSNFLSGQEQRKTFSLISKSFKNNGRMPAVLATEKVKGGKNISPALKWENAPEGTKSFALICIDMNPIARRWIHWMVVNIPVNVNSIAANASSDKMPAGCVELENSYGYEGWGGPQPPKGTGVHKYIFVIYALDVAQIKSKPQNEKQFLQALKGKVVAKAMLSGLFQR